jgi:hypothetical protein
MNVRITSTVGGPVKMVSPWRKKRVISHYRTHLILLVRH